MPAILGDRNFRVLGVTGKAWAFGDPIGVFVTEDEILLLFFDFRGMNRA